MTFKPRIDAAVPASSHFEPAFAAALPCEVCGASTKRLEMRDFMASEENSDQAGDVPHTLAQEDANVEAVIQMLEATGILDDLPASMRLIEHIAESVGYRRAQQPGSSNVTELMLMAARASALADRFRQDD